MPRMNAFDHLVPHLNVFSRSYRIAHVGALSLSPSPSQSRGGFKSLHAYANFRREGADEARLAVERRDARLFLVVLGRVVVEKADEPVHSSRNQKWVVSGA